MRLAQIIKLALRQLDEDPADIADYEELFTSYANMGYAIAMKQYYKPRETMRTETDARGSVYIQGMGIERVIKVLSPWGSEAGFTISDDGAQLQTGLPEMEVTIVYEPEAQHLGMQDEPKFPGSAHHALADYICYRHLSSGNLAKQSRAEFFRSAFYQQMNTIRPQSAGSVTRMKNLYAATDIGNGRW